MLTPSKDHPWNHRPFLSRPRQLVVLGLLAILVAPAPPVHGDSMQGLNAEDVAALRSVSSIEISADGSQVLFLRSQPRKPFEDEDGPAWNGLHLIAEAGAARPFVTGEINVSSPAWSPDDKSIYFLQKREGDEYMALYAIPVGGGEAKKVHEHEKGDIRSFDVSADGRQLAYLAAAVPSEDEEELHEKGFNQEVYEEQLHDVQIFVQPLDVQPLAVQSSNDAVVDDADKKEEPRHIELAGSVSLVRWAPDSTRLLVAVAPTPLIDDEYMKRELAIVDSVEGKVLGRIAVDAKLGQVAWSPDGKHVAAITGHDLNDTAPGRLKVAAVPSGSLRDVLAGDDGGHVATMLWSDVSTITFVQSRGVWRTLETVSVDGTGRSVRIEGGGPIWSQLSLADDGTLALAAETPQHPRELYVLKPDATAAQRWTDSNAWLADRQLGTQEVVTYAARDGLEIDGILIRPPGTPAGQRLPLILTVHGGPESHYSNGWLTGYSLAGHQGAARGFAVFYPNYRGSTGRGVEFAKLSQADPAGKEFNDLVDGVDHLIEKGWIDRDRVGITGGSYGGYATAWGSTYFTERFAAGVMFVGISDEISKMGTTDIPEEMYLVHMRHWPWEDWNFLLERSPIYYVEQARTPLLIMHGAEDPRVHPGQSMELYRFLKILGKTPVRFVRYPGEGHGNRRAASRYDYNLRLFRWMEHYLQGEGGDPPPPAIQYPAQPEDEEADET